MYMAFFKPTSLLDKFYEVGILIKGFDGLIELISGVLLLAVPPHTILGLTNSLTHRELGEDPHDFIATHVLHLGAHLAAGHNSFVAAFLLIHGAVKVGLVVALLLNKIWAYPIGLSLLSLLFLYQVYDLIGKPTVGIALLSVLDAVIIWLVWREWQKVKDGHGGAANTAGSAAE